MSLDQVKNTNRFAGRIFGTPEGYVQESHEETRRREYFASLQQLQARSAELESFQNSEKLTEQFNEIVEMLDAIKNTVTGPIESSELSVDQLKDIFSNRKYVSYEGLANRKREKDPVSGEEKEVGHPMQATLVALHIIRNFLSIMNLSAKKPTNP